MIILVFGVQVLVSRLVLRVEPTMQAAVLPSSHVVLMGGLMRVVQIFVLRLVFSIQGTVVVYL